MTRDEHRFGEAGVWQRLACRFHGIVVLGLLAILFLHEAAAVTFPLRWRWSNPRPHGGNVVDMTWWGAQSLAVQVAERGQVYASTDLGLWIPFDSGTTNDLRAVATFGSRLLVTGTAGRVLYADDLGAMQSGSLDVSTTDWLEAVAASPQVAVAVGDNGIACTSSNGIHWKRRVVTDEWLRGVAWAPTGGFVAVGEGGRIISSLNGTNWTQRTSGTSLHLNRVVFAGGRYLAVGEGGVHLYSLNGTNWFSDATGAAGTNDLFHAAATNGTRLVVGENEVRLFETPGGWSNQLTNAAPPPKWTYFANLARQVFAPYYFIAGRTGMMFEGIKTNGTSFTWSPVDQSIRTWLWSVHYATNLYVTVGDYATVMTSGNGVDWNLELVPDAVTNAIFLGVGGTTNLLVTAGSHGSLIISPNVVSNYLMTNIVGGVPVVTNVSSSSFGVLWYAMNSGTTNELEGVAARSNLFVVTGAAGAIITSPDGTNWTPRTSGTTRYLSGVTAWPGGWIATGDDGVIVSSVNGLTWTVVSAPNVLTANWLYRVRYLGGRLVAVGQNGTIVTSTNGTSWTKHTSTATGTTNWLNDITFVDGTYFVIGNSGTVLASTNATQWTSIGAATRKHLYGAASDTRQFVAVGVEGVILRSPVVPDFTPMMLLDYDRVVSANLGVMTTQNIYLFGGHTDQQFTLDHRGALDTNGWFTGPPLEIIDGSGTLYYLETFTGTNMPPTEFYRTTLPVP